MISLIPPILERTRLTVPSPTWQLAHGTDACSDTLYTVVSAAWTLWQTCAQKTVESSRSMTLLLPSTIAGTARPRKPDTVRPSKIFLVRDSPDSARLIAVITDNTSNRRWSLKSPTPV